MGAARLALRPRHSELCDLNKVFSPMILVDCHTPNDFTAKNDGGESSGGAKSLFLLIYFLLYSC